MNKTTFILQLHYAGGWIDIGEPHELVKKAKDERDRLLMSPELKPEDIRIVKRVSMDTVVLQAPPLSR